MNLFCTTTKNNDKTVTRNGISNEMDNSLDYPDRHRNENGNECGRGLNVKETEREN